METAAHERFARVVGVPSSRRPPLTGPPVLQRCKRGLLRYWSRYLAGQANGRVIAGLFVAPALSERCQSPPRASVYGSLIISDESERLELVRSGFSSSQRGRPRR